MDKVQEPLINYIEFRADYKMEFGIDFNVVDGYYVFHENREKLYKHMMIVENMLHTHSLIGFDLVELDLRPTPWSNPTLGIYRVKLLGNLAHWGRYVPILNLDF